VQFLEGAMSGCSKTQIKNWDYVDWDAIVNEWRSTAALARELDLWVAVRLPSADPAVGHIEQVGRDENPPSDLTAARA
jgi:hypothetical protein